VLARFRIKAVAGAMARRRTGQWRGLTIDGIVPIDVDAGCASRA
jgi:hypothetical protein